jgi:hypothetical protein
VQYSFARVFLYVLFALTVSVQYSFAKSLSLCSFFAVTVSVQYSFARVFLYVLFALTVSVQYSFAKSLSLCSFFAVTVSTVCLEYHFAPTNPPKLPKGKYYLYSFGMI